VSVNECRLIIGMVMQCQLCYETTELVSISKFKNKCSISTALLTHIEASGALLSTLAAIPFADVNVAGCVVPFADAVKILGVSRPALEVRSTLRSNDY